MIPVNVCARYAFCADTLCPTCELNRAYYSCDQNVAFMLRMDTNSILKKLSEKIPSIEKYLERERLRRNVKSMKYALEVTKQFFNWAE